jgi:hypothetical protein
MSACDGPELRRLAQPGEGRKFAHVVFISATAFGIGDVGEPFELGRNVGEIAELGRRQCFPVQLSSAALADAKYYKFVQLGVRELCQTCNLLPCIFDAAVFSLKDGNGWKDPDFVF